MQLRCTYCQTLFAITREEMVNAFEYMEENKQNDYDVHCPKCLRANRVERERMERFFPDWKNAIKTVAKKSTRGKTTPKKPTASNRSTKAKAAPRSAAKLPKKPASDPKLKENKADYNIVECPNCKMRVVPKADGTCPSCQAMIKKLDSKIPNEGVVENDDGSVQEKQSEKTGLPEIPKENERKGTPPVELSLTVEMPQDNKGGVQNVPLKSISIKLTRENCQALVGILKSYSQNQNNAWSQWASQLSQTIQSRMDKSPHLEHFSITLNIQNWNAICEILKVAFTDKNSERWLWAIKLSEMIQGSINSNTDVSAKQPSPIATQPKQQPQSSPEVKQEHRKVLPIKYILIPQPPKTLLGDGEKIRYGTNRGEDAKNPGLNAVFLEAARLELYRLNAFHVMELPVDATPRDLTKRQQIVEMAINTGLTIPPGSGRALPFQEVTNPNALREAVQRLRDPERRLVDEFFWFWPYKLNNSSSDEALHSLACEDVETACKMWSIQEQEQSEANISVHNLGILAHIYALELEDKPLNRTLSIEQEKQRDVYWDLSFKRWKILLANENFWNRLTMRIRDLDDPRLTTGMARRMRDSLPLMLLIINAQLAVRAAERGSKIDAQRHRQIMNQSGFEQVDIEEALRRALGPTREMIKSLCQAADTEASADPKAAGKVSLWLLEQVQPRLAVIDYILPAGHPTRDSLHDDVAQQMLTCQFAFGNKTEDWQTCQKILKLILSIAAGPFIRVRVEENLKIVKSFWESELCWFCKKRKGSNDAAIEVKMYGEVTNKPLFQSGRVGNRIEWKQRIVKVPRCTSCKEAHNNSDKNSYSWIGGTIGFLVGIIGCVIVISISSNAICGGIIFLLFLTILGASIGAGIQHSQKPTDILPISAKNEFPVIKGLKTTGWFIGEKPPNVQ